MRAKCFLFFLLVSSIGVSAQVSNANRFSFYAKLTDLKSGDKLANVSISVEEYQEPIADEKTDASGKFKMFFEYGSFYTLTFSKTGYVSKIIEINTKNVPLSIQEFGNEYGGWNITMVKKLDGIDYALLKNPIAKVYYDTDYNQFDYDREYARQVVKKLETLNELVIEKEEALENKLAELNDQYDDLIKDADRALNREEWEEAKKLYTQASELKTNEGYPITQLEVIAEKIDANKQLKIEFDNFLAKGERLLAQNDFQGAKEAFTAAQNLQPKSSIAQQKIVEVDTKLNEYEAEKAKEARLAQVREENFKEHIATASSALEQGSFNQAKLSAEAALKIKPGDVTAKNYLAEAEENIAAKEAAKQAELLAEQQQKEKEQKEEEVRKEKEAKALAQSEKLETEAKALEASGKLLLAKQKYEQLMVASPQKRTQYEQKLKAIDQTLLNEANREQKYQQGLNLAGVLAKKGDLKGALEKYKAISVDYPEKREPIDFIASLEARIAADEKAQQEVIAQKEAKLLAERKQAEAEKKKANEQKVSNLINQGDVYFRKRQYEQALQLYQSARKLDAENLDLKKKIKITQAEIDRTLAKLENDKTKEEKHLDKIDIEKEPDEYTDEFLNELAKQFPEGVTEKVYKDGNKTITKRIVVKGGIGTVYRRVHHNWGGEYFFRNNDPISEFLWDKETVL